MERKTELELAEVVVDTLDHFDGDVSELHNEAFNTDYFIIGYAKAENWLKENYGIFKAMDKIKEYEQFHFGEVTTDLSSSESVCNMLVYILGEELLGELSSIQSNWDVEIDEEIKAEILEELNAL